MLHGQAESVRIEDPGVTKAEFVVTSGGQRELHQAKRSHPDGKWTLASMAASDVKVLQAMNTELAGNNTKFFFVSSSDAGDLRDLTERARDAESMEEFEGTVLFVHQKGKAIEVEFTKPNGQTVDVATLVFSQVRLARKKSLRKQGRCGLSSLVWPRRSSYETL